MAPAHQLENEKNMKNKVFPLNPAQKAAAEAPPAPLLIVAGAGTGKTRTLTSRIAYLIETGMPAGRICAITFTNKAAEEMKNRVGNREPFIGTFHSLGARILRKECRAFGRDPNFAIFDDHDSFGLVKKITKKTPALFARKISEMKNVDNALLRAKEPPERAVPVQNVFDEYEAALARNNAFDFDDLIQKSVALFRQYPEILEKYRAKFDALLVDEYQDINPKQCELVKLLAGGHNNVSVVGDDEQTIYSWRYADIKMFLDFDKAWPGAKVYFLEENYRSTGVIIRAAAAVAENNRFRAPKKLWTQKPDGERITLFEAWGEDDEAEWIAEETKKIKAGDARAEVAVLYRTNAQSRAVEQALIRRDMPYRIFGGLKFYERREVKDVVAALRVAANGRDEMARERLEKNLSKKKFAAFKKKIGGEDGGAGAGTDAGTDAAATQRKPSEVIKLFLEAFGYFDYLEENFTNAERAGREHRGARGVRLRVRQPPRISRENKPFTGHGRRNAGRGRQGKSGEFDDHPPCEGARI